MLKKYKGEIIAAVLSASVTAVVSLIFGLYSLSQAAKDAYNQQLLFSINGGIDFLERVDSDLDENTVLLSENDYRLEFAFSEPYDPSDSLKQAVKTAMQEEGKDEQDIQSTLQFFEAFGQQLREPQVRVLKTQVPFEWLAYDSWYTRPESAEVDFQLLRKIKDHYLLLRRLNAAINSVFGINEGAQISAGNAARMTGRAERYNEMLKKVSGRNTVTLKNEVKKELERLRKKRTQLMDESF